MIVDPDFLDHWRTTMVVDLLDGDHMAPVYILRLWAHCQTRKSDRFELPTAGLKAQCRYQGDAQKFEHALTEAGFVSREGGELYVVGWAEKNSTLLAAWANGNKGGRPKNKPTGNPRVTHGKPTGNPAVTQSEPMANPWLTQPEPIREDKRREDKRREDINQSAQSSPVLPDWLPMASWSGYLEMRKKKRKEPTARAIELLIAELTRLRNAGHNIAAILDKSTVNGWTDVYAPKPGDTVVPIKSGGSNDPRFKGAK